MKNTAAIAVAYYTAFGKKNLEEVSQYLHPAIQFTDPQEKVIGKEEVLRSAKRFFPSFKTLTIQEKFGSEDRAMIIYEVEIPGFSKSLRVASLLSFHEGLISKIDLIYDMSPFQSTHLSRL